MRLQLPTMSYVWKAVLDDMKSENMADSEGVRKPVD